MDNEKIAKELVAVAKELTADTLREYGIDDKLYNDIDDIFRNFEEHATSDKAQKAVLEMKKLLSNSDVKRLPFAREMHQAISAFEKFQSAALDAYDAHQNWMWRKV